ncbi:hypothetical protein BKA66DRAFT_170447 [Pyrenochaeta sp. MPI-SDFR-AT-0127]|nr:hypothetical protein BKA66DRAFT_170447 [Pyrenochaeta sp. MPI-SDFR-AT-0127]
MATEQHSRPNTSNATPGLVGILVLLAVALFTYAVRMYTRIRKLTTSDYFLTAGLIGKLFFALGLVAFWASSLARISIGCMLLCFPISKAWKTTLWILLAIQLIMPLGANIFALLQCRPVRANWEPVPTAVCWPDKVSQIYGYIYASFGTLSDIIFASMPVHIFWSLHRPVLERMLGVLLMGFGIIAALASAMKIYHISAWNPRQAQFRDWVPLLWWYRVEEIGLIVAACAPFLKPLMEHALQGLGVSPFRFCTITLNTVREEEAETESTLRKTNLSDATSCSLQKMGNNSRQTDSSGPSM